MIALIDRGLYNRTDTLFRSVPEERAMRYSAVSLGADPYLPSRYIESFLRVFKQFACNIPRG